MLLNKMRVTQVAATAPCKAFTQTNANHHLCSHSHSLKMKLFANTSISLLRYLMGQGQILSAGWHLLSGKYRESLVRVDSASQRREQKKLFKGTTQAEPGRCIPCSSRDHK